MDRVIVIDGPQEVAVMARFLLLAVFCVTPSVGRTTQLMKTSLRCDIVSGSGFICRCAVSVYSRANNVAFLEPVIA